MPASTGCAELSKNLSVLFSHLCCEFASQKLVFNLHRYAKKAAERRTMAGPNGSSGSLTAATSTGPTQKASIPETNSNEKKAAKCQPFLAVEEITLPGYPENPESLNERQTHRQLVSH